MENENLENPTEKFFSKPGMVFPLYHVLSDICEMANGAVLMTRSSKPLTVNGISMVSGNQTRILVYNLTWEQQDVSIRKIVFESSANQTAKREYSRGSHVQRREFQTRFR